MAPKAKKGKKGKGKGKKGKKGKKDKKVKEMTEVTKAMFEIMVRDLTEKLERCRGTCDQLTEKNQELVGKLNQQTLDLGDVIAYLKLQLNDKSNKLEEIRERLEGVEAQKEREGNELKRAYKKLESEIKKRERELTNEIELLNIRLNSLEEFRRMRDKFFEEKYALERLLEQERRDADQRLHDVDQQRVLEIDRLKHQAEEKIEAVAQSYQQSTRKRIHQTTVRAIRENICITEQMRRVTERADAVERLCEDQELQLRDARLQRSIQQRTQRSLVTAKHDQQAEIEQLQSEHKRLEHDLADNQLIVQRNCQLQQREQEQERRLERHKRRVLTLKDLENQQSQRVLELTKELADEVQARRILENTVREAGEVLHQAIALPAHEVNSEVRGGMLERLMKVFSLAQSL